MKKSLKFFFVILIVIFSSVLSACGSTTSSNNNKKTEEKPKYTVTYKSVNTDKADVELTYEEGSVLEYLKAPNNYQFALYSLTNSPYGDGSNWKINIEDLGNVYSNKTIYCKWIGKFSYANCFFEGNKVGKAGINYDGYIWTLPDEENDKIGTIWLEDQTKDDSATVKASSASSFCKGYNFEGWYYDEQFTKKVTLPIHVTKLEDYNFYGKRGTAKIYDVNIKYKYYANSTSYLVYEETKKLGYDTNLNEYLKTLPSSLSEYELISSDSTYPKQITVDGGEIKSTDNGWADAHDTNIVVYVKPKYAGYFEVKSSTNPSIDGQLLPYDCLETYYQDIEGIADTVRTTKIFGSSTSISYKLSDIEEIKFKNGATLPEQKYKHTYYQLLPNLKKIDLSEMKYLAEIPQGFFYGAGNIEEVYAPLLPNLKIINEGFLCFNKIKTLNFDFSNVEEIGDGFLDCAFDGTNQITIDLSNLKKINGGTNYAGCGFLVDTSSNSIMVKLGNFVDLSESKFYTYRDEQWKSWVANQSKYIYCTSPVTIYSHDAVALQVKLYNLTNVTVTQY